MFVPESKINKQKITLKANANNKTTKSVCFSFFLLLLYFIPRLKTQKYTYTIFSFFKNKKPPPPP